MTGRDFDSPECVLKLVDKSKIQFVTDKVLGSSESSILFDIVVPAVEITVSVRACHSLQTFFCGFGAAEKENLKVQTRNRNPHRVDAFDTRFDSNEFLNLLKEVDKVRLSAESCCAHSCCVRFIER
jgi:hypothetical protein